MRECLVTMVLVAACGDEAEGDRDLRDAAPLDSAGSLVDANGMVPTQEAGVHEDGAAPDAGSQNSRDDAGQAPTAALSGVKLVALGLHTTCAARASDVLCWGPVLGNLGREDATPTRLPDLSTPSSIAIDDRYGCATTTTDTVCWGAYANENREHVVSPKPMRAYPAGKQVVVGNGFVCTLSTTGDVRCFGKFDHVLAGASTITSSVNHVCALKDRRVYCWGRNDWGEVDPLLPKETIPNAVMLMLSQRFEQISAGDGFTCAVSSDEDVICWGNNESGQLGHAPHGKPMTPIPGLYEVSEVAAGGNFACAVHSDGMVSCWGLGYGTTPVAVPLPPTVHVAARRDRACAILRDRTLACWMAGETPAVVQGPS